MADPNQAPSSYLRSTGDHVAFWVLWVLLLLPAILLLMMVIGSMGGLTLIPLLAQLGIHGMALKWFLDLSKPSSKALLMLLGGTGLLYFLAFGGCLLVMFTV